MRAVGAREEARDAARLREAAEIQERERRRRREKRELVERTRDLKQTVSELERQVRRLAVRVVRPFIRVSEFVLPRFVHANYVADLASASTAVCFSRMGIFFFNFRYRNHP